MLKKEDVERVAKLSRLKLSDAEIVKFAPPLSYVFKMFGDLDTKNLDGVEETSQVTGLKNILRDDEAKQYTDLTQCTTEELLANTPQKEGTNIVVPRVIEK